jgi:hypothetical protein
MQFRKGLPAAPKCATFTGVVAHTIGDPNGPPQSGQNTCRCGLLNRAQRRKAAGSATLRRVWGGKGGPAGGVSMTSQALKALP